MARTDAQLRIRLPKHMRDWLDHRAKENFRSIGAEVALMVRDKMAAGGEFGDRSPAAGNENAALPGGAV